MKLASVRIKNFRSIKDIEVDFDPACRVLVGINESGKTNILKALHLMRQSNGPDRKEDLREALPDEEPIKEAYVRFRFNFDKTDSDRIFAIVSTQILSASKNPIMSLTGKKRELKQVCADSEYGQYNVNILEEKKRFQYFGFDESFELLDGWQKPTKTCPENFTVEIKTNRYAVAKYKLINRSDVSETIPDGYFEDASFEELERTVGLAAIEVTEQQLPETLFWQYNENNLLPSSIGIPEFAKDPSACVPLKNMFILAGISDISTSLPEKSALTPNQFQNYLNNIARKTTSHFRDVWKDYKDIEFSLHANGDRIVPGIKEKNTHDMGRRSDGFKRFVTFLLLISVNVKTNALTNTLLLIDEPDTSLHPSGARYLRDELIRISKTNYVLYSTHSIFMIDSGGYR